MVRKLRLTRAAVAGAPAKVLGLQLRRAMFKDTAYRIERAKNDDSISGTRRGHSLIKRFLGRGVQAHRDVLSSAQTGC